MILFLTFENYILINNKRENKARRGVGEGHVPNIQNKGTCTAGVHQMRLLYCQKVNYCFYFQSVIFHPYYAVKAIHFVDIYCLLD